MTKDDALRIALNALLGCTYDERMRAIGAVKDALSGGETAGEALKQQLKQHLKKHWRDCGGMRPDLLLAAATHPTQQPMQHMQAPCVYPP